ncbi:hypothetical protein BJ875DRAFT_483537 [Amylocarpus encephaloides]|uniref:Uncharacterized protein n=1 Tax=Amylocarpus encephaloides TaxID=45428 RepID=A0A9P7YJZ3_9HELO|nr:hypothetical protein BJ875DRAFT_483537 [Amylocarpus encephaloides]
MKTTFPQTLLALTSLHPTSAPFLESQVLSPTTIHPLLLPAHLRGLQPLPPTIFPSLPPASLHLLSNLERELTTRIDDNYVAFQQQHVTDLLALLWERRCNSDYRIKRKGYPDPVPKAVYPGTNIMVFYDDCSRLTPKLGDHLRALKAHYQAFRSHDIENLRHPLWMATGKQEPVPGMEVELLEVMEVIAEIYQCSSMQWRWEFGVMELEMKWEAMKLGEWLLEWGNEASVVWGGEVREFYFGLKEEDE